MQPRDHLTPALTDFITSQPMFFVATAARDGRVNVSPKGLDSLRVINDRKIIWLSLSGSGNETAAHLLDSPRMTLMFCAFAGEARILRTYGAARAVHPQDTEWPELLKHFPTMAGSRQIFILDIDLVSISCGSGVPLMNFVGQRGPSEMLPFYDDMGEEGVKAYWQRKNTKSIDGKPTGMTA